MSGDPLDVSRAPDNCSTCGGIGEVSAYPDYATDRTQGRDSIPCPECVSRELNQEIGGLKELVATLRAYSTPQPIDTAPKDGSLIIGLAWRRRSDGGDRIWRCWWQPEFEAWIEGGRKMSLAPGLTFEDGRTSKLHSPDYAYPTHWLPMPADPEAGP